MRHSFFAFVAVAVGLGVACGGGTVAITNDGGSSDAAKDGVAPPDTFACNAPGECDIRPKSCCGTCGAPTTDDMIGVNWQKGGQYTSTVCAGAGCPACFKEPDPNLAPVCRAKACNAVDVRVDTMSACTTNQDCALRYSGCCEACAANDPSKLIALSSSGRQEYVANQCHPDAGGCPKCAVIYPPGYEAVCNTQTGHCEVGKLLGADAGGGG